MRKNELLSDDTVARPEEAEVYPEPVGDSVAPVVPDELIKADWHRHLVLPDRHGQLRLTSVETARNARLIPSTTIRYLDEPRRHSA